MNTEVATLTKKERIKKHFFQIMEEVKFVNVSDNFLEVINNYDTVDIKEISRKLSRELSNIRDSLLHHNNCRIGQFRYDESLKFYEYMTQNSLISSIIRENINLDILIGEHFRRIAGLNYTKEKIDKGGDPMYWLYFETSEKTKIEGKAYLEAVSKFKYKD